MISIMRKLHANRIPYTMKLKPRQVMVHPRNRGELGVSAFNVHTMLATVKQIGADPAALLRAMCFEMAPVGPDRQKQIDFNN